MKFIFLFLMSMASFSVCAQESDSIILKKNSVHLQFLGNSANLYDIGYERIIKEFDKTYLSLSIGGSYLRLNDHKENHVDYSFSLPFLLNFTTSKTKNSHLDIGTGLGYKQFVYKNNNQEVTRDKRVLFSTWRIGYKYQRPHGGFLFKAALTPTFPIKRFKDYDINRDDNHVWDELVYGLHYIGVSFGYTF